MNDTICAYFENESDGIQAAESLMFHGVRAEKISLVLASSNLMQPDQLVSLKETVVQNNHPDAHAAASAHSELLRIPQLPPLPVRSNPDYFTHEAIMAPGARGYTYDALGAVIPDSPPKPGREARKRESNGTIDDGFELPATRRPDPGRTTLTVAASEALSPHETIKIIREFAGHIE
jgi:hypothetical protein